MEAYMRLVGSEYLKETLWPVIEPLTKEHKPIDLECEDAKKIDGQELYKHVDQVWTSIQKSTVNFPV